MHQEANLKQISKFLSFVLRHKPEHIGIRLDSRGWVDTEMLIAQANAHGLNLTRELLREVVETNNKQRFAFNETGEKIRANQGHSLSVDLDYAATEPPQVLYHGTASRFLAYIEQDGILRMERTHVHLSPDIKTAIAVGGRHGKPVVFEVAAARMHLDGLEFFLSQNGVWLTDHVPPAYLRIVVEQ
jgi:putative RNA 2'-phosphotransferase